MRNIKATDSDKTITSVTRMFLMHYKAMLQENEGGFLHNIA